MSIWSNNSKKLHAKQYFQTDISRGYVRYGCEPHVICLLLNELAGVINKSQSRENNNLDFDPNIYVYMGIGEDNLHGVYRLTEGKLDRVSEIAA